MTVHLIVEASGKSSPAMTRFDFDHGRITVGRASTNDWVLDDPDHVISKTHCELKIDDAGLQVVDRSSNGVFLNGSFAALGRGNSELLKSGDRLQIGEYIIRVEIEAGADDDFLGSPFDQSGGEDLTELIAPKPQRGSGGPGPFAEASPETSPFGEEVMPARGPDPLGLDDVPEKVIPERPAASDHLPLDAHFMSPPAFEEDGRSDLPSATEAGGESGGLIPEDWDLTGLLGPDNGAAERPQERPEEGLEARFEERREEGLEEGPGEGLDGVAPADFDSVLSNAQEWDRGADKAMRPAPDAAAPPSPVAESFAPAPSGAGVASLPEERAEGARRGGRVDGEVDGPFSAFLDGAGIRLEAKDADAVRAARKSGVLFRKMLEGLMVLLQARMVVKNEYQLERTLLRPVANNPLKSLPSVDEILAVLYRTDDRTGVWLDAEGAVDEAVQDLKSHDLALVAGMNAVVEHFVAALAPQRFEDGREEGVKKLLSISTLEKAKSWDRFEAEYAVLQKMLEDGLTGEARAVFERAYNREKQRLEG